MSNPILPVYKRCNLEFISGQGCYLSDIKGNQYLDLGAGIAVNSLGYQHPKLVNALCDAAQKPWHVSNLYNIPGQKELANKLVNNSSCDQVFFCNSGTESVEAAIKIIRKYHHSNKTGKQNIITFENAFHGRTIAAISASGNKKHREGYAPLLQGFINVPEQDSNSNGIKKYIDDTIAAVIIEPIQGEGGVNVFAPEFLKELEDICKKNGIILVVDEVQCGIGRTGKLFHYQWSGINPDIITVAKGVGGGFPLAACLVKNEIGKVMECGSHGGTYGGNPLAMSVGNAVLDEILSRNFLDSVIDKGKYFKDLLLEIQKEYPNVISAIKGEGLILGIKAPKNHMRLVELFRDNKLLTIPAGNDIIRIIPPLIISKEEIESAINIIKKVLDDFDEK